jgi:ABC-type uncharacterized transport system substrate-binding protein
MRKVVWWALVLWIALTGEAVMAQQAGKIYRVGVLSVRGGMEERDEVFRKRLNELGYIEGKNLIVDWRFSDGKPERIAPLIAELTKLNVDVLFGSSTPVIQTAKNVTKTIPIIMTAGADPAETGLVASLERPGGNITGLTSVSTALNGKRMALAKEVVPNLARVGVLLDPEYPTITAGPSLKDAQSEAASLGLKLQLLEVRSVGDLDNVFEAAIKERTQALIHFSHAVITNARKRFAELALKNRLPAVYADTQFMEVGGLMSLGADPLDLVRRAAEYVDKILKGGKPAEMAIGKPAKFELVINTKVAEQMGLAIPSNVLARADRMIK